MLLTIMIGKRHLLAGISALVLTALVGVALVTAPVASATTLASFGTHGEYAWKVPAGVSKITIDAFGASGGSFIYSIGGVLNVVKGGLGGEARGTFEVKPGETLQIWVGGKGGDLSSSGALNGFNGGGGGGANGAGGGGASDVRRGSIGDTGCAQEFPAGKCYFTDRWIVAAGGGGAGRSWGGGNGGGLNGSKDQSGQVAGATQNGQLVTQLYHDGAFGYGGYDNPLNGPGGGGGWYGGDAPANATGGYGGGGGCGYISGLALNGSFPGGTHSGDGLVVITSA
jgi:hypothetical protein